MLEKFRQSKWFPWSVVVILVLLTLASRLCIAYFLATDEPGDGRVYSQLAKNLLEQNVYSLETAAPFNPTLIRLPGYPLFLAAVYSIFGVGNDTAVRLVQSVFDTATCSIITYLAWLWTEDEEHKKRNAFWTFLLVSLCPFIVIYTATLLTETLTTFLMAAMALTATFAFQSEFFRKQFIWWFSTGILAGLAVLLRPDSGLFAAAIGLTLVVSGLFFRTADSPKFSRRFLDVTWKSSVFTLAFILVLIPWTIRNYRIFGVFQPLAPAHAEMPGEFVPFGYQRWLRTWVDDSHFIEPTLWKLDEKPLKIGQIPAQTFDSPEERERVKGLLEQYNHPPGSENQNNSTKSGDDNDNSDENADSDDEKSDDSGDENADSSDDKSDDSADKSSDDSEDSDDDDDENKTYIVKMTPEIDAGFAQIADERITHSPLRYYVWLPIKRAAALWFDSHSLYYSFGGQMSPVENLDYDVSQQYWLPFFTILMWIYTILAIGGARLMWRMQENRNTLRWLILLTLFLFLRIGFFATIENPEPRYVVELFALTAILGGFYLGNFRRKKDETEEIPPPDLPKARLFSLDVFRGITIAAMILVNNPGSWEAIYSPLEHAEWNGATPTDLIFPFFLFIVGISITFAFSKQIENGKIDRHIYLKVFKRSFILFALGLILEAFPFYNLWKAAWFEPSTMRISGVLQRIAVCYFVSAIIFLRTNWKTQTIIAVAILLIYWLLMTFVSVPDCDVTSINDKACNLSAYLDRLILTTNHIWYQSKVFDPEGVFSTIPAIATTLAGVLTGSWLKSNRKEFEKVAGIFFFGVFLTAVGWIWSFWFPLNKNLWTSSYVIFTAGLALCFLGFCYWLIDLKGYQKWSKPFVIFGTNAIALYIGSTILGRILMVAKVAVSEDETITLQEYIFTKVFLPIASPINASLLYAIAFILLWLFLLWILYRKRIFIKI